MPQSRWIVTLFLCILFLPLALPAAAGQTTGQLPGLAEPADSGPLTRQEKLQRAKFYYAAGESYIQQGNFVAADEAFKKAQTLLQETGQPITPSEAQGKDSATEAAPQADAAPRAPLEKYGIDEYLSMLKDRPYSSDLYYNLGLEYLKQNQFAHAADAFKKTVALNPKDQDACYNLGVLYENFLKDKLQALAYYKMYLKLAPRAPDAEQVKKWIKEITATEPTTR